MGKCCLCYEQLVSRVPFFCTTLPLEIKLPADMRSLCFWCRQELYDYYKMVDLDEEQITLWVAQKILKYANRAAGKRPLQRCEVGFGRGRCMHFAREQRYEIWVCGTHTRRRYRHYLDWRCANLKMGELDDRITVLPPDPVAHYTVKPPRRSREQAQKGDLNGNARLTAAKVIEIKRMIKEGGFNTVIARHFGVTHSLISAIRRGKNWAHVSDT